MVVFADYVKCTATTGGRVGGLPQFLSDGDGTSVCSRVSWEVNRQMVTGEEGSRPIASVWPRYYLTLLGGTAYVIAIVEFDGLFYYNPVP